MTKEIVARRSVLETPRLPKPLPRLDPGQVVCAVCEQPGEIVPDSAAGKGGLLIVHPGRLFPCRQSGMTLDQAVWLKMNGVSP